MFFNITVKQEKKKDKQLKVTWTPVLNKKLWNRREVLSVQSRAILKIKKQQWN